MNIFKALYVLLIKQTLCAHKNKERIAHTSKQCESNENYHHCNMVVRCDDCGKLIDIYYKSIFDRDKL